MARTRRIQKKIRGLPVRDLYSPVNVANCTLHQGKLSPDGQIARTSVSAILTWNREVKTSVKEVTLVHSLHVLSFNGFLHDRND